MREQKLQELQEFVNSNLGWWIAAVVACFIASLLILKVRNWYHGGAGHADSETEILTRMREMHREGQISDDEYRSIKGQFTLERD